ncbi:MAG: CBS domain-containing protein [Deltaproteobacteria bacterium]|nr:MAG: CBS domain-containing protein [Deltaproteobacteria bacterium]
MSTRSPALSGQSLIHTSLSTLNKRAPVMCEATSTVREAAQHMTSQGVSSLLVMEEGELVGIVTDRDMRTRVLAGGFDSDRPLRSVMTTQPHTLPAQTTVLEAMMFMAQHNIHHLPLTQGDTIQGLVTANDLLRFQSNSPVFLVGDMRKQTTVDGLVSLAQRIPSLLIKLVEAHTPARNIGQLISTLTDTLHLQLLQLAEAQFGPPPFPYAWVVAGSQARREQSSFSDQDNALILAEPPDPEQGRYFHNLATFVSDALNQCGFVYCPGNIMATNPEWRRPLVEWQSLFSQWIQKATPDDLLHVSIFFDMRALHDPAHLLEALMTEVRQNTPGQTIFLAHMAHNALTFRPPLGWFRRLSLKRSGPHKGTLDLKQQGLTPIVDLARVHSLSLGLAAINTYERLEQSIEQGQLNKNDGANLLEALEFLSRVRLRLHAQQTQEQLSSHNHLSPKSLSLFERSRLREVFQVVQNAQSVVEMRYPVG